jgi:replicative DNA helicase
MCLAFLAGVDEEHILTGEYFTGEWERIEKAKQLLKNSKIHFECMPDFTMQSIETVVKKHIRENNVQYVWFDYIHSSASILLEVGGNKGIKGLHRTILR